MYSEQHAIVPFLQFMIFFNDTYLFTVTIVIEVSKHTFT